MTKEQISALRAIGDAIVDACKAAGEMGAPGGHLYAALMAQGCTLSQFQSIMSGLELAGLVTRHGECYRATR